MTAHLAHKAQLLRNRLTPHGTNETSVSEVSDVRSTSRTA